MLVASELGKLREKLFSATKAHVFATALAGRSSIDEAIRLHKVELTRQMTGVFPACGSV